jgi:hypothetical protein
LSERDNVREEGNLGGNYLRNGFIANNDKKNLIYSPIDQILFVKIALEGFLAPWTSAHAQEHPRHEACRGYGGHDYFRTIGDRFDSYTLG